MGYLKSQPEADGFGECLHQALVAGRIGIWEYRLEANQPKRLSGTKAGRAQERLPGPPKEPATARGSLFISPEVEGLLGLQRGRFDGRLATVMEKVRPTSRPALLKALQKAIRRGSSIEVEVCVSRKEQGPAWLLIRGGVSRRGPEFAQQLAGVVVDITAQKSAELRAVQAQAEAERRLAAQSRQLRCVTDELEDFCYSVSHDLRAPLRSIRGFNEVLLERHAAGLEPRALEFLRRACESSRLMARLIEDLLRLSRVGQAEMTRRPVDLGQLATPIIEALRASAPERQVNFQVAPGLEAVGDPSLLRLALENLLGNAWKFTGKQAEARIELGSSATPRPAYFVRDNGAGFDPAYQSRLFGVFQRLHVESEFPGKGIGLAMVQRIIHRHGGEVWAEGGVGTGATFYFSLPNDELS